MAPLLLALLALGQTTWQWTDAEGVQHFTDDPSTIPKGVKARTTEGEALGVITTERKVVDAGVPEAPLRAVPDARPADNGCVRAQARVQALEKKLAEAKTEAQRRVDEHTGNCQAVLRTHGEGEYAKCMARGPSRRGRADPAPPDPATATAPLAAELDQAREVLRRRQVGGCGP